MKFVPIVARVLLGVVFLFFGVNYFTGWVEPEVQTPEAQAFLVALDRAEFMHPLRSIVEAICGALLLMGVFVPLALVMLAPILVHIVLYHVYLDPGAAQYGFTGVLLALALVVAGQYRKCFAGLFAVKGDR